MAGPTCSVCSSKRREEVDAEIAAGKPLYRIAVNLGYSNSAMRRHAANCVPKAVAIAERALSAETLSAGLDLTEDARDIQRRTLAILTTAERTKKLPIALQAIREARGNLELLGRFTGKLRGDAVNIFLMPEWVATRDRLISALRPYPDALEAVGRALTEGETNGEGRTE